jgi:hypothetical protein
MINQCNRASQSRSDHLTAEHGDFVTKYDDLNSQFTVVASAKAK